MDTRKTRTWAEVSLGALRHNVEEMQRALPDGCGLLGVVKADAYGHGASEIAAALRECGCRYLAVQPEILNDFRHHFRCRRGIRFMVEQDCIFNKVDILSMMVNDCHITAGFI